MMSNRGDGVSRAKAARYWKGHIEAWQASGDTQSEYCRQHELKLKAFAYWKRKFDESPAKAVFHPVRIVAGEAIEKTSPSLSLMIGSRYCIEIRDGFNPATLRQIVETLER
jgi:hypothetical protein